MSDVKMSNSVFLYRYAMRHARLRWFIANRAPSSIIADERTLVAEIDKERAKRSFSDERLKKLVDKHYKQLSEEK